MRRFASFWAVAALLLALPATAQDIDDLDDLDEGVVLESPFEPGIEPNVWELSLNFGNVGYATTLVEADGIVVDVEDPVTALYADTALEGESSFNPQFRVGRTFGTHFALEASFGFAIGDFEQTASNFVSWSDPNDDNTLTEVEREKGSYFVYTQELAGVYYPRGEGRVQPYLIGSIGQSYWELDSNYVDGITDNLAFSYGAGLRIVADDLYSFRVEVRQYRQNVQFELADTFFELPNLDADGLVDFPVSRLQTVAEANLSEPEILAILDSLDLDPEEFRSDDGTFPQSLLLPRPYPELEEQTYTSLFISAGFTAAF